MSVCASSFEILNVFVSGWKSPIVSYFIVNTLVDVSPCVSSNANSNTQIYIFIWQTRGKTNIRTNEIWLKMKLIFVQHNTLVHFAHYFRSLSILSLSLYSNDVSLPIVCCCHRRNCLICHNSYYICFTNFFF